MPTKKSSTPRRPVRVTLAGIRRQELTSKQARDTGILQLRQEAETSVLNAEIAVETAQQVLAAKEDALEKAHEAEEHLDDQIARFLGISSRRASLRPSQPVPVATPVPAITTPPPPVRPTPIPRYLVEDLEAALRANAGLPDTGLVEAALDEIERNGFVLNRAMHSAMAILNKPPMNKVGGMFGLGGEEEPDCDAVSDAADRMIVAVSNLEK